MTEAPLVTLVVAMRNEEQSIEACLESLAQQDYPADRLEILVYDGMSTDRSWDIASGLCERHPTWRTIQNPAKIQAAAWNAGIDIARGSILGIVSGHVTLATDYVRRGVEVLDSTGAAMVGGPTVAEGVGPEGRAIAIATSSRFGVGGAAHHYARTQVEVDTVFMGICRIETYRAFRFDEAMVRNQDDELSFRIRKAGGRIVCDPSIRSVYKNRSTLRPLFTQYKAYGYWKALVFRKHPAQMRARHFAPSALVIALVGAGVAAATPVGPWPLVLLVGAYLVAAIVAALQPSLKLTSRERLVVVLAFVCMHLSYGIGMLQGLLRLIQVPGLRRR